jgi:hypothetical protein
VFFSEKNKNLLVHQGAAVKRVLRNRKGILNRTTLVLSNCQYYTNPENIKKKMT